MASDEITWRVVQNTVAKRMVDLSLIHKLIPGKRLRRRTKAMNAAIKEFHVLKTYSQYIKLKTSVIRNLSDDMDTDDNSSFTEDDYNIVYKSDLSLTNYLTEQSKRRRGYLSELDFSANEYDATSDTDDKKDESEEEEDFGWQEISKKKKEAIIAFSKSANGCSPVCNNSDYPRTSDSLDNRKTHTETIGNVNLSLNSIGNENTNLENDVLEQSNISVTGEQIESCVQDSDRNVTCNATEGAEVAMHNSQPLYSSRAKASESNKCFQMQGDRCHKVDDIPKILAPNVAKIDGPSLLGKDEQTFIDARAGAGVALAPTIPETLVDNIKNGEINNIQSLSINGTYQPKDSGIEEDTEEDLPEYGRKHHKKMRNTVQKADECILDKHSASIPSDHATDDRCNLEMENCDSPNRAHATDIPESLDACNGTMECEVNTQRHRLQPKVTRTEIVSRKYKIICEKNLFDERDGSEESTIKDSCNEQVPEREEVGPDVDDSISPLTKKRLQQLRRLNLTVDSDSSLSESEDMRRAIEDTRNKLFKQSTEYSKLSDSSDKLVNVKHKLPNHDDETITDIKKVANSCTNQKGRKKSEDGELSKEHALAHKNNASSQDSFSERLDDVIVQNGSNGRNLMRKENLSFEGTNASTVSNDRVSKTEADEHHDDKKGTASSRPRNVQELLDEEDCFTVATGTPTFTFKGLEEHELFIIDVPATVLDGQLIGSKIVLTEKKLKLGKQKYKVTYKDTDNVTCVFPTGKSRKPYKTVNIRPMARVVARRKVSSK